MIYLLGDIQGCCEALEEWMDKVAFSPSRDQLFVLGDLVNRGPASLATLERLQGLGAAATCLLGNHDLHLLAASQGIRKAHRGDTLGDILNSPKRAQHLDWLRHRPLAAQAEGWLLVHAGVAPQWTLTTTLHLAAEVQAQLRSPEWAAALAQMYGNTPAIWLPTLAGAERSRFIINAFTRIRFCDAAGALELETKEGADAAPAGLVPWFEHPARQTTGTPIAFGHWSTLGLINRPDLLALDTGCVWGGALTGVRVDGGRRELVQVPCTRAQAPGP
jgi:bis(5'-nucleosyl)-tetraphosphatase (symmetrical)